MDIDKKSIMILVIIIAAAVSVSSLATYLIVVSTSEDKTINISSDEEMLEWTEDDEDYFDDLTFSSTGNNTYFILEINYTLFLEGEDDEGEEMTLEITVTNDTEMVGDVETRVVIEDERVDGEKVEISYNFFAYCIETGDIYYFGEEVDIYEDGKIVEHEGAWRADEGDNKAGIIMLGSPQVGARYYQEVAEEDEAMDRAEVLSVDATLTVPVGTFENCLITEESTPVEPLETEFKYYAPGVGLICEEELYLTDYGFNI